MNAGEIAAMVAAVTGVATVGLLAVWLVSVTRSLTALQHDVAELRREPLKVVHAASPERVQALLVEPEPVRPAPPRLASVAFSDPVIKAVAFASGASKAVRSFRRPA